MIDEELSWYDCFNETGNLRVPNMFCLFRPLKPKYRSAVFLMESTTIPPDAFNILKTLWSHTIISRYSVVSGATFYAWEYFLTLPDEIEYFWYSKWSFIKFLFFLNRYHRIPIMMVNTFFQVDTQPNRNMSCSRGIWNHIWHFWRACCWLNPSNTASCTLRTQSPSGHCGLSPLCIAISHHNYYGCPRLQVHLYSI
ncbi:hypothetical protein BD779DRAFT_1162074 [Infundibulicybe gibba]|nr:hypothetical protein BD779DRAFT_1162074 [Infundibulicybe gibba]